MLKNEKICVKKCKKSVLKILGLKNANKSVLKFLVLKILGLKNAKKSVLKIFSVKNLC